MPSDEFEDDRLTVAVALGGRRCVFCSVDDVGIVEEDPGTSAGWVSPSGMSPNPRPMSISNRIGERGTARSITGGFSLTVRDMGAVENDLGESGVIGERESRDDSDRFGSRSCRECLLRRRDIPEPEPDAGLRFGLDVE